MISAGVMAQTAERVLNTAAAADAILAERLTDLGEVRVTVGVRTGPSLPWAPSGTWVVTVAGGRFRVVEAAPSATTGGEPGTATEDAPADASIEGTAPALAAWFFRGDTNDVHVAGDGLRLEAFRRALEPHMPRPATGDARP